MKMLLTSALVACLVAAAGSAAAQDGVLARDFQKHKGKPAYRMYLYGVGNGYVWASTYLEAGKKPPLFCQPSKMSLTEEIFIDLIDQKIQARPRTAINDGSPVDMVLLVALQEAFPCRK